MDGVNAIKGEEGTSVRLTILRGDEVLEISVTRAEITDNNVTSEIIDNIGYIRVYSFGIGVYDQFKQAYDEIMAQNIDGLIVDLRK